MQLWLNEQQDPTPGERGEAGRSYWHGCDRHGLRRLHRGGGHRYEGSRVPGQPELDVHDPGGGDIGSGWNSRGHSAVHDHLPGHRLPRDGQEERPGAKDRRRGDPGLRLGDLQRQDRHPHRGEDDHDQHVVLRRGLQRHRPGLRSNDGPHREGGASGHSLPRRFGGAQYPARRRSLQRHRALPGHGSRDGGAGLAVPRQFFGGAFGGGRPEGRRRWPSGSISAAAQHTVLLGAKDDAHGQRREREARALRERLAATRRHRGTHRLQGSTKLDPGELQQRRRPWGRGLPAGPGRAAAGLFGGGSLLGRGSPRPRRGRGLRPCRLGAGRRADCG
mmetsp:Transcript_21476/g.51100  ORF Transcript_21476/g.51100 Transcript_21476/m.51100 type:complete len:332 (+) Transcript_21476:913-1908(+)